jgi:hypothetical protein
VKGALVRMLLKYECLHLFPVPSSMSAGMRKALYPSGAKDDPRDAGLLLDLLVQERDQLRPFLERWPSLEELKKVPPAELRKFFGRRQGRHQELTKDRIQGIVQAMPASSGSSGNRDEGSGGASDRTTVAQFTGGDRESGTARSKRRPVRIWIFSSSSRCRERGSVGVALFGGLRLTTGSLRQRRGGAETQWDRNRDGGEWEEEMGAFPLGLRQVSATKFSRMGGTHDWAFGVGPRLLRATAPAGQRSPCRGESLGLQTDSHRVPLLERSRSV